jgi:hypothetical protein
VTQPQDGGVVGHAHSASALFIRMSATVDVNRKACNNIYMYPSSQKHDPSYSNIQPLRKVLTRPLVGELPDGFAACGKTISYISYIWR